MKAISGMWCLAAIAVLAGCSGKKPATEAASAPTSSNSSGHTAAISASGAASAGIEVTAAGPTEIRETLTLYGTIKPNAEREQDIRARYPGVVRTVDKRAGEHAAQGESLMTVESNESLQVYPIKAPLGGQVLERNVNPGDAVDSGTVLMKVADLSTIWVEFAVFARDMTHVRRGMPVQFRGPDADEIDDSTISYVAPAGHADSQSVVARAVVDNRRAQWVPGQFVTGEVVISVVKAPVTVVPAALQELQGKTVVFVQVNGGFELREVQLGKRSRDAVQILSGIAAGERYASVNSYLIKADLQKSDSEED